MSAESNEKLHLTVKSRILNTPQTIDDFWDDCIVTTPPTQTKNEYITFNQTTNPKPNQRKSDLLLEKYNVQHLVPVDEIEAKIKDSLKKKQATERCYLLYEKGKIKNEVNRIMFHKNAELRVQNDLKICTWKPKLNKQNKKQDNIQKVTKETKIYSRNVQWKGKMKEKIHRSKSVLESAMKETFKPKLNTGLKLEPLFDSTLTVFNSSFNREFINRYGKARLDEEDKKRRMITDVSRIIGDKWEKRNLNRSCSMTEREKKAHKETLRDQLHSISYDE